MKRKIDKINNKRLVMGGGINNLTSNEILVEQKGNTFSLKERVNGEIREVSGSNSGGGGGSTSLIKEYYLYNYNGMDSGTALILMNVEGFYIKGVYKNGNRPSDAFETNLVSMALGGETNFGEGGFSLGRLKGLQYISANDEGVGMLKALEHAIESGAFGDVGDMTAIDYLALLGLTQCTKEEYEALLPTE